MTSPESLWETWTLTKQYRVRPSELYHLSDELEAYYFDRAVATFGWAVEADLDRASADAKSSKKAEAARQRALDRWMGAEPKFRDPAAPDTTPKKQDGSKKETVTSAQDGPAVL